MMLGDLSTSNGNWFTEEREAFCGLNINKSDIPIYISTSTDAFSDINSVKE